MAEKMILKISFLTGQSGHLNSKRTLLVNLFTAMLAAPSLMNESDKLEITVAFFSPLPKMHSIKRGFVTEPSNILFAGVYVSNI